MGHTLKVGDILDASWGYDQTNVDFYEVVRVTPGTVDLHELEQVTECRNGWNDRGTCRPIPGTCKRVFKGKRPNARNIVKFSSYNWAYPWDGSPKGWSSYA